MSKQERRAPNEFKKKIIVNGETTVFKKRTFSEGGSRGKKHREEEKRLKREQKRDEKRSERQQRKNGQA